MTTSSTPDLRRSVATWIDDFSSALRQGEPTEVADLLIPDAYWRDILALTWGVHTFYGREQIELALKALPESGVLSVSASAAMAPRLVRRAGREAIEALIDFRLAKGTARGIVRLVAEEGLPSGRPLRAWTVLSALEELAGHGERLRDQSSGSRDFSGPNWRDRCQEAARFDSREPEVLVVGAGQAGLAVAARLRQLDVDALVVDRMARVGDNWRKRYHALVLHNEVWANHLPYLPFPDTFPTYLAKDLLADWFEAYAGFMELNIWTGTQFEGAAYDASSGTWQARLHRADGSQRVIAPKHIIMAVGVSGIPYLPELPGFAAYSGQVFHSSQFTEGSRFCGKKVLVIGTGTSGHDVAQDLWSHGADVTIVQRSPSTVVSVGPQAAGRVYSIYQEGDPTEITDLVNIATPYPVLRHSYQLLTRELKAHDAELLAGLERVGFRTDYGEDNTGFQMKYLRRGGGYYLDVGCADLIINGSVKLLQFADIDEFTPSGVRTREGREQAFDAVVLATGYYGQQELIRRLFSHEVAQRVGPIWGFDEEGELRNMWQRTGQPGLWFTAGSLAQCRIFSQYLALQIKACQAGLLSADRGQGEYSGTIRPEDLIDM
jgi:hypothetical protein